MSKSTLWAFGCSFTHESAFPGLEEYVWPSILGELLDVNVKNTAESANSMYFMTYQIISNLHLIKEGDIVVVGTTYPARYSRPELWNGIFKGKHFSHWTLQQVEDAEKKGNDGFLGVKNEEAMSVVDFLVNEVESNNNLYDLYWNKVVKDLFKELKLRKVKVLIWTWKLWSMFERFEDWDITFDDGHWSPNGHKEAAEFFNYCILHNIESVSDGVLRRWRYDRKLSEEVADYIDFSSNFTREGKKFTKLVD